MRADARGRRAGGSHVRGQRLRGDGRVDGRLPTAVPRRVRERPRGFVPARMLARGDTLAGPVASPRPPGPADSRPGRNDRRDAGGCARLALAGEAGPARASPGGSGGCASRTGRRAAWPASARRRASARVRSCADAACRGTSARRPAGPRGAGAGTSGTGCAPSTWEMPGRRRPTSRPPRPPSRPRSPATGRGPGPRGSPGPPTWGRPSTRPCARGTRGLPSALAFAAEVGDFSRFASGRKVTSYFGLAPSESSSAESRRLGRIPGNGCALVRKPLIEGAWVLARGNPACRKRGGASVPFAIREHARACSGRLLERRGGLIARGPVPREANTATAAEMARMLLYIGRDAQEAAVLATEVARAA